MRVVVVATFAGVLASMAGSIEPPNVALAADVGSSGLVALAAYLLTQVVNDLRGAVSDVRDATARLDSAARDATDRK